MILCVFALAVGSLTVHRIRSDFNHDVLDTADQLSSQLTVSTNGSALRVSPPLGLWTASDDDAAIRIFTLDGRVVKESPSGAPWLGSPQPSPRNLDGYRVVSVVGHVVNESGEWEGHVIIQYARRFGETEATVRRVELGLLIGVLAATALALLAGMALARRAMAPIAALTSSAAEIARTRDPSRGIPQTLAEDEVSELARTLEGMLRELDAARGETEAMLVRQRQFVADASHELRTPLTSVLANLELLAESLHGDEGDAARSALRSSQRMRRLVGDLLLLARTDAARVATHEPCDLAQIVVEAAGELGSVSAGHEISIEAHPAIVSGARDDLHRLTINLLENAIRHTPAGTEIRVATDTTPDGQARLVVEDDGPGVPDKLASNLFERFVRGAGDRGGSFGLGLAIVHAVAVAHGGTITLEPHPPGSTGARFVVRLPGLEAQRPAASILANRAV